MAESAFTNKPPVAQLEVLQRSKNYLVTFISKSAPEAIAHQPIDERFTNVKCKSSDFWRHINISSSRFGCPVETVATN